MPATDFNQNIAPICPTSGRPLIGSPVQQSGQLIDSGLSPVVQNSPDASTILILNIFRLVVYLASAGFTLTILISIIWIIIALFTKKYLKGGLIALVIGGGGIVLMILILNIVTFYSAMSQR
jgi:hypothetical protein